VTPPVADKRPLLVERHGESFEDPYAWLRNRDDPDVKSYLEAENAYAEEALGATIGLQQRLYDEMLGRIKQTDLSVPAQDGEWWYLSRTEEGEQYRTYARRRGSEDGPEEIVLDLNRLAEGKSFMALGAFSVTRDGNLLAYSTDETGFREYRLQVKNLATGQMHSFERERVNSVAWGGTARRPTLFYVVEDDAKRPYRLYRHPLGGEPVQLFEEKDEAFRLHVGLTRSRAYLILIAHSHTTSEVSFLEASDPEGEWGLVAPRVPDREYDLAHQGDRLIIRVNDTGRNFRLVSAPVTDPAPVNWLELVPHRDEVMLEAVDCFKGHIVLSERTAGLPRIVVMTESGETKPIPVPEAVCEAGVGANLMYDTSTLRYHFQSLVTPNSVFDYDVGTGKTVLRKQTEVLGGYDPSQYRSLRGEAIAADGTAIPLSIVSRRDRPQDGTAPLLLEGYGSYGISYPIGFSSNRLSLLDRGFAIAIAHVRGGGELGKPWHDAGRMKHKMKTFTDFIAAAEHLVSTGWTSSARLAIEGGSAGGLLMGTVVNLRPELFGAVMSHVPFVDVINTMSDETLPLTVGEYEEWGNPKVEEQFRWMRAYCPYTNLQRGPYPPMLVRTAFNDSQVMYWEPAKYVARLRTLKTDTNPLLLVTNMGAGHGGASGRYDRLREIALDYAFLLTTFRVAAAEEFHGQ